MVFKIALEPSEEGGYTAIVPALPGCISEGDTIREAVERHLEPLDDYPTPKGASVKRPTLCHILKQPRLDVDQFMEPL